MAPSTLSSDAISSDTAYDCFVVALQANGYPLNRQLVVMEATGPYWIALAVTLAHFLPSPVYLTHVRHCWHLQHRWRATRPRYARANGPYHRPPRSRWRTLLHRRRGCPRPSRLAHHRPLRRRRAAHDQRRRHTLAHLQRRNL